MSEKVLEAFKASKLIEGVDLESISVDTLVDTFSQLRMAMTTIEDSLDKVQNTLKQYMLSNHLEETVQNGHKITYKEVASNRFDTTRFRHECPETYEQYLTQQFSMRFNFR